MAYLVAAGSVGIYGVTLLTGLLAYYLVSCDSWGTPLLAPFSPLIRQDLRDSVYKADLFSLRKRPQVFEPQNRTCGLEYSGSQPLNGSLSPEKEKS